MGMGMTGLDWTGGGGDGKWEFHLCTYTLISIHAVIDRERGLPTYNT